MSSKYKVNINDLESKGGIDRMRANGISNEQLHKSMYRITDGMTVQQRRKLMSNLYTTERREKNVKLDR